MTYLSGKFQKRKTYTKHIVIGCVLVLIAIFWPFIKKHTYGLLEPVVVSGGNIASSFSVFPEFFYTYGTTHKALVSRQKELELEIEHLENMLAEKDAQVRELTVSSSSHTDVNKDERTRLVAYPLMHDVTKLYSTVLLSKGFKDGVDIGNVVTLRGDQVVCTIKEVYAQSSLCLLLSSSGVTTEGVTSSSSITLSLIGRGGYYMANVARDTPVSPGEKVYLRSNQGLLLGTVKQVTNNNQDTSWHVFVEGGYNPITSSIFYVQP